MKIKVRYGNYIFINVFLVFVITFGFILFGSNEFYVEYIQAILTLISVVFLILHIGKIYGNIINFHSLILMSFYVFFLGRQFTGIFGYDSYQGINYGGTYTVEDYGRAFYFSYICIVFFAAFSTINYSPERQIVNNDDAERIMYKYLKYIFWICLLPMVYYYYILISSAMISSYGTKNYQALIANSGYFVSLLRQWGILSLVGLVCISFISNVNVNKTYIIAYLLFTVVSLFSGGRTEGISLLLILVLLYSEKNKGFHGKQIGAIILIISVLFLVPYLFVIRQDITQVNNVKIANFVNSNSILSAIHEMGGSASPLLLVQKISEREYGKSYILAILNTIVNFLPKSIRPDFSSIGALSLAHFFTVKLGLNYGLGFNLVAEAFYNFGVFGFGVFIIFGVLFRKVVSSGSTSLDFIIKVMFVFFMFTMARRESKDLFSAVLYYWFPFVILSYFIQKKFLVKSDNNEK